MDDNNRMGALVTRAGTGRASVIDNTAFPRQYRSAATWGNATLLVRNDTNGDDVVRRVLGV